MTADDSWRTRYLQQPHCVRWVAAEHFPFAIRPAVVVSLTLRLVLCYDGYRLPRSLERRRSLLMGSTSEINAVHLCRGPRQQQVWAVCHHTRRHKWGSIINIWWMLRSDGCSDAEAKHKIKKAERKLPMIAQEDTHQYHSSHSLTELIYADYLTTIFGCFLLYWVYISGYLFIKQYHLIY